MNGFELPRAIHLEPVEFSVDNGFLTPSFKLKRPNLKKSYLDKIEELYATTDAHLEAKAKL